MPQELDLAFVADRVAEVDALLTFVVECAQNAADFPDFQAKLQAGLGEVKITAAIDIEKWLDDQHGYVVLVRLISSEIDYLRDDTGLPELFPTATSADKYCTIIGMPVVRIVDLKERREKRNS